MVPTRSRARSGSRTRRSAQHVKLAGVVRRITVRPLEGTSRSRRSCTTGPARSTVVWMGRRSIPGFAGDAVVVDGVLAEQRGDRRIVNPSFEFVR